MAYHIFLIRAFLFIFLLGACGHPPLEVSEFYEYNSEAISLEAFSDYSSGGKGISRKHSLYPYMKAASYKKLPTRFFRELIKAGSSIAVKKSKWPKYKPGIFYGGTIYHPAVGKSLNSWNRMDWQSFYNELFHAWWQHVFDKSSLYTREKSLLQSSSLKLKYKRAHKDHWLAQEEAYSETVAALMVYLYPMYRPNHGAKVYFKKSFFIYDRSKTVAPVGHSERGGYSPEAARIYPNPSEYRRVFLWLTGRQAPLS